MTSQQQMREFRVYSLSKADKIRTASWVRADSLASAIHQARQQYPDTAYEIWEGPARVAMVPA